MFMKILKSHSGWSMLLVIVFVVGILGGCSSSSSDGYFGVNGSVKTWAEYTDDALGVTLQYPDILNYKKQSNDGHFHLDFSGDLFPSGRSFVGGMGGPTPLIFSFDVFDRTTDGTSVFGIEHYIQDKNILDTRENSLKIGENDFKNTQYLLSAPEGAQQFLTVFETEKNGKMYAFVFTYNIGGCDVVPEKAQEDCREEMEIYKKDNTEIIHKILETFGVKD